MQVIIRTHVKNQKRFDLLKRTVESALDKGLARDNEIRIVDDCSPKEWGNRILDYWYTDTKNISVYVVPRKEGNTKQGLAYSLIYSDKNKMTIHCVDDMVFGNGAYEEFRRIEQEYIPQLEKSGIKWGMIGSFACYNRQQSFSNIPLWHYPTPYFYAGVCHVINPSLGQVYINEYNKLIKGLPTMIDPIHADDLWVKGMCIQEGYMIFNTLKDYAQHTGANCRTFGEENADSSNYTSGFFVGE